MTEQTHVGHTKQDSTDVYIGRGPNGRDMLETAVGNRGWLGNPFTLDEHTREESIEKFRDVFYDRIMLDDEFREAVKELRGETLGCWCQTVDADSPACHGEVIAEYLNQDL